MTAVAWHVRGMLIRPSAALVVVAAIVAVLIGVLLSPASAQRARPAHRVGVLNDARAANHPTVDGLKAGLRDLALQEGRDVTFDVRLTEGNPERMHAAARGLVKAGVDVIFASGDEATRAAQEATKTIPVVFTLVGDPVAAGVVTSLAHPAGNLTGVSSLASELVPKRLEVLKTLVPGLRRVWAIAPGADPESDAVAARALEVSSRFGIEVVRRTVGTEDDLAHVLESLRPGDALLVPDVATMDISAVLLETSLAHRIPAMFSSELWVSHGGLVSYGADYRAQGVQAARLVAKILRGTPPRDLPVEGADPIVLAVNLKTAAAFGLTVPRQVLFRADMIRR